MASALELSDDELNGAFAGCSRQAAESFHERRASSRWAYPAVQPLAPYGHWGFPKPEMFREVRCHDISTGGVSFLNRGEPEFVFGVIGLGPNRQKNYFVVRVVHCREFQPGANVFIVGCEFVERIHRD